jgi:hypothetical protein
MRVSIDAGKTFGEIRLMSNNATTAKPLLQSIIGHLLPVQGSGTNWSKNLLVDPTLKISVNGVEILAIGKLIIDSNRVDEITRNSSLNMVKLPIRRSGWSHALTDLRRN